jgi:hypothetical protein
VAVGEFWRLWGCRQFLEELGAVNVEVLGLPAISRGVGAVGVEAAGEFCCGYLLLEQFWSGCR